MSKLVLEDEYWFNKLYEKSNSSRTVSCARTSLRLFDFFCARQNMSREQMIRQYQYWYEQQPKPDVRNICMSLDKFVSFLNKDHDEIISNNGLSFKKKNPKSIKLYFGFVKSYLRICHDVRLNPDDVKDYMSFPKIRKDPRKPISFEQLKLIINGADPKRRALYSILASSGMRLGEALTLTKKNFHMDEVPVRISIEAEHTKTLEGRDVFISSEAVEKVKPLLDNAKPNEMFFINSKSPLAYHVSNEVRVLGRLRECLSKTKGGESFAEKYPNSIRSTITLHNLRAWFFTVATKKHGDAWAHKMIGHHQYLDQYNRLNPEENRKMIHISLLLYLDRNDNLVSLCRSDTD